MQSKFNFVISTEFLLKQIIFRNLNNLISCYIEIYFILTSQNCSSNRCCVRLVDACYDPIANMLEKVVRYRQFNQTSPNPQAECEEGIPDVLVTDNRISIISCLSCNFDCPAAH